MLAPTTIFNTVISFLTNTNLQHYSGEQHLSYFSQIFFVLLEHVRLGQRRLLRPGGHHPRTARRRAHGQLLPRHVARLRLHVRARQPGHGRAAAGRRRADDAGRHAPGHDASNPARWGPDDEGQAAISQQQIARGPVAAIMPIKHLGTNGGGFFGANSAHPFENPSAWTNFLTVHELFACSRSRWW